MAFVWLRQKHLHVPSSGVSHPAFGLGVLLLLSGAASFVVNASRVSEHRGVQLLLGVIPSVLLGLAALLLAFRHTVSAVDLSLTVGAIVSFAVGVRGVLKIRKQQKTEREQTKRSGHS
jgi:uncharacterized membrane protein HdeD (DUF308 family)